MNAPEAGTIVEFLAAEEDTVVVGQDLLRLETGGARPEGSGKAKAANEEPKGPADSKQEPGSKAAPPKEERDAAPKPPAAPLKQAEPRQEPKKQDAPGSSANSPFGQREERRVSTATLGEGIYLMFLHCR